jgi:hypothetical protein
MTCQKVRESFWEYQRRPLPVELASAVETHLRSCVACASELDHFRQVEQALAGLPIIEPSPYFDQKLNAKLADISRPSSFWGFLGPWWKDRYVWTFALVLVATTALWLGFRHQQGRQLNSIEDVIRMQDEYLGKDKLEADSQKETAIKEKSREPLRPAAVNREEELIPEEDLAVVENFDLLQNYEFLKKFDLADTPAEANSGIKPN